MKKVIMIILAAVVASGISFAQDKGTMYAGGGFSGSFHKNNGFQQVHMNIAPEFGMFVSDDLSIGAFINSGMGKTKYEGWGNASYSTKTVGLGVRGRYYLRISDNFYYTPTASLTLTPMYTVAGHDDATTYGLDLDIAQFEYRPDYNFGCYINVLGFYALASSNKNVTSSSSGLAVSPSVGVRFYF